MLDRTKEPKFGTIDSIELIEPTVQHLSNGLPVFSINAGVQDVLKVELIFGAGTATADKLLVGSSTVELMKEGTEKRSAAAIAEAVDFYGAYLQNEVSFENSSLSLFTLNKHLSNTLPTLAEVYHAPAFSEEELSIYRMNNQQEMLVKMEKVSYLCSKGFSSALFGSDHPFGRSAVPSDYEKISREDLVRFHQSFIHNRLKYIMVAGKLGNDSIALLDEYFGEAKRESDVIWNVNVPEHETKKIHIEKADAVQNAIRIGRVLFSRTHPDYIGMQILATVLGGYFGSRLMSNIREDKGYTYGVGAGLVSLNDTGYLSISTEVGSDVCAAAVREIYFEIERLRKDLIPHTELDLVKNYMLGSLLKTIDGPFQIAAKWKNYLKHGLGMDAHHDLIHRIKTITPERLRELAQKYLQPNDLIQVTAGRKMQ